MHAIFHSLLGLVVLSTAAGLDSAAVFDAGSGFVVYSAGALFFPA
jgi:hypothetical protein